MDRADHLAHIRRDGDLLLDAATDVLDRDVPTCPGWSGERLVGHVGRTHRWTAGWIATGESPDVESAPPGHAVVPWARAGLDELLAALETLDPGQVVDTWLERQPAIFWSRRMAVETALHRVDAQLITGPDAATPVGTELAVEGVDEMFEVVLQFAGPGDLALDGRTIHLHATDETIAAAGSGEWLITLAGDGITVAHEHAKGDLAVRGPASDLFLLLWNRRAAEDLQVFGDESLIDAWRGNVRV